MIAVMMNTKEKPPMLDIEAVATRFNISPTTVRRLANSGRLIGYKIHGQYRFEEEDVEKYKQSVRITPKEYTPDEESEDEDDK